MSSLPVQPFDFYVVLDFEAAFDKAEGNDKIMEIIEFPSVLIDATTHKIVSEFQRYARPVINPVMHPLVTELTGITQQTVNAANTFPVVYAEYRRWLLESGLSPMPPSSAAAAGDATQTVPHPQSRSFAIVTCGDWDIKTMLPTQIANEGGYAKLHEGESEDQIAFSKALSAQWINLKDVFNVTFRDARITGMTGMLQHLGLPLVGRHHSGIDDCRNIAAVLVALMQRGVVVDITATRASLSLSQRVRRATHDVPRGGRGLPGVFPEFHGDVSLPVAPSQLTDREAWAESTTKDVSLTTTDAATAPSPSNSAAPAAKPKPKKNRLQ